jgi:hypothetical protein
MKEDVTMKGRTTMSLVMVLMFASAARAEVLPFGKEITPADRTAVMKLLGPGMEEVNPQKDLRIAKMDLNGDGRLDYVVVVDNSLYCGSGGCHTAVYLSRGSGYRSGLADPLVQTIALAPGSTQGVRDLELTLHGEPGTSRWTWDGTRYRRAR